MVRTKGAFNQIVYWSRLPDWKNQTLTPNPDSIYLMPFINTKDVDRADGALEIPAADEGTIVGTVMDCWQAALEDVGPAGVDKGKGGKYLILASQLHKRGAKGLSISLLHRTPIRATHCCAPFSRAGATPTSPRLSPMASGSGSYPLSQAANPPETKFVDAVDVVFDATIPYDLRFFQSLDRMAQNEPWLTRDKAMIDQLKSIGIEKGNAFRPDTKIQEILKESAREAHAWIDVRYEVALSLPYYEGSHWAMPASQEVLEGQQTFFANPDSYPVDGRGVTFAFAFFSPKHLGAGSFYLMTIQDKGGRSFDGGHTYRLTVPANAPVKQYWSATVYDRATHALIRNQPWSSRSSLTPGLRKNDDGSADVYFGPKAPAGKDSNWIPTIAGGRFEVLFRFYGPEKPLFDKTWKLPDIEPAHGESPQPTGKPTGRPAPKTSD